MKILHLTPSYLPARGGVETHVAEVTSVLENARHEVVVLTHGQPVRRSLQYKLEVWKWLWRRRKELLDADVVHVHDVFWWVVPFLPLISHKVFTTFHGWETVYPVKLSAKVQRFVWSWLSVRTIHVGDWIKEFYWDVPDAVTYGAPPADTSNPVKPSLQLNKVAFFGRLSPENEIEKYLELFAKLTLLHPRMEVIWIGDGPLRSECEKVGTVTGMVDNPEKHLRNVSLVGASSYLAIWQAQALGKVCLGFHSHKLKQRYLETFPNVRNMIIANNVESMVSQVESLFSDPKRMTQLQRDSRDRAVAHRWENITAMYLNVWQGNV